MCGCAPPPAVPAIAVLTTCYNDGAVLPEALDSLAAQTCTTWEHILVNNGSTDGTHTVARAWQALTRPRTQLVTLPHVRPQPVALNRAVLRSRARWLVVLNADDTLVPDALSTILYTAEKMPDVNCIFSPWQMFGASSGHYDFAPYTGDARMLTEHQVPGIRAVRRDLWDALGGEDTSIAIGADWDWAVRGAARGLLRPFKVPRPLWNVRDHGPGVKRLSAQCDHTALRVHMAGHFTKVAA